MFSGEKESQGEEQEERPVLSKKTGYELNKVYDLEALYRAVKTGNHTEVICLLASADDLPLEDFLKVNWSKGDNKGDALLHIAVKKKDAGMVRSLLA